MKITLSQIKANSPCEAGFKKLLKSLNKTKADDTQVSIKHILESNGVLDTLWVIDNLCEDKRKVQLMCADFAERVLYIWEDWAKYYINDKDHFNAPRKVIELIKSGASEKEITAAVASSSAAVASSSSRAAWAARAASYAASYSAASVASAAAATAVRTAERRKQKEIILKYFD